MHPNNMRGDWAPHFRTVDNHRRDVRTVVIAIAIILPVAIAIGVSLWERWLAPLIAR